MTDFPLFGRDDGCSDEAVFRDRMVLPRPHLWLAGAVGVLGVFVGLTMAPPDTPGMKNFLVVMGVLVLLVTGGRTRFIADLPEYQGWLYWSASCFAIAAGSGDIFVSTLGRHPSTASTVTAAACFLIGAVVALCVGCLSAVIAGVEYRRRDSAVTPLSIDDGDNR